MIPALRIEVMIDAPSLIVTTLWFIGCMNIWNLIDGMDGLASGVGLLVAGTLMLVALHNGNTGSAVLAAALVGSLAGFLLYNWHPACIFLGDSGSLLLGLLLGVIGVQGSMKGTTAVSILFPLLAMGLPVSDTAMAIFRRWVRDLPLSAADRRHIHHLLIGLGLDPRQAAAVLYFFTAGLCGVVLLGVAWHNELLAVALGISGCAAFLLVLTSRRDELAMLLSDFRARRRRRRDERDAASRTWEAIQRIELCGDPASVIENLDRAASGLGASSLEAVCRHGARTLADRPSRIDAGLDPGHFARFRIGGADGLELMVLISHDPANERDADIVFRGVQRVAQAAIRRLEVLTLPVADDVPAAEPRPAGRPDLRRPWPAHAGSLAAELHEGIGL